ncbi:transglutaminase family protein [Aquihabitans sp. McL0605]|uniref:transglutaminase family protein n=1 Tax=Aquihabitans sp. McL0605 TaxID=3415671 RepID=UPI003CEC7F04
MTWRLQVTHTTKYTYSAPVAQSYNEARLEPRSDRHQAVLASRVEVDPSTRVVRHVDYWGSVVHHFDVQVPHQGLTVVGRATVETGTELAQPGEATWEELRDPSITDQFEELLIPTQAVTWDDEIASVAAELAAAHDTPAAAAEGAAAWVNDRLEYRRGSTGVQTTSPEVLAAGSGVCQDFAHVNLALLRAMGIPSWYVSGYLHPDPKAEIDDVIVGESHAWVAAFTGTVWPLDPTSLNPVAERHIRVAAGRDYHDVAPFRGIYAGRADQELEVTVELVRKA